MSEFDQLAAGLDGVTTQDKDGLRSWRYHGRVVARSLDDGQVVLRTSFDGRDDFLARFPDTFSVPRQFVKHMMMVADLRHGRPDAIEDALMAAWSLQAAGD